MCVWLQARNLMDTFNNVAGFLKSNLSISAAGLPWVGELLSSQESLAWKFVLTHWHNAPSLKIAVPSQSKPHMSYSNVVAVYSTCDKITVGRSMSYCNNE